MSPRIRYTPEQRQQFDGTVIEENAFLTFEPGSEFSLSTKVEHDWCSIFIPTHVFDLGRVAATEAESDKMICRTARSEGLLAGRLRASVAVEYFYGRRVNFDTQFGENHRLNLVFRYMMNR